ncbi:unnamed protein product [Paramecium pentaurelia]|uniref:Uncharacterized protein n=1 Tax=Paramecium pentaurelia TaxID=43138 RepID=A0A8S1UCI3_9CILI|nr:unnamed protein product [Paramecium pentaurelia]
MIDDEEQNERIITKYRDTLRDMGLMNLGFGSMFLLMSINKSFYENDECIFLRQQGLDFGIALLILSTLQLSFFFVIHRMEIKMVQEVFSFLTGLTFLMGLIFFVLLSYGIYKGEPCGALRILSIVYIVLVVFSLFCFALIVCCVLILSANER